MKAPFSLGLEQAYEESSFTNIIIGQSVFCIFIPLPGYVEIRNSVSWWRVMVRRTIKSGFWKNRFLAFWCQFEVHHPNLYYQKRQMFNYGSLMSRRTVWATQNSNQFCSGYSVNLRKWSNVTLVFHVSAIHGIDGSQYYSVSVVGWLVSLRSLP